MPAVSKKQANLFRAALGDPKPGTGAAKIKATVSRNKIKDFTHTNEAVGDDKLKVAEAINVLANYIVTEGDTGVHQVERLLKNRISTLKQKVGAQETIRNMVKEVINEMTTK